MSRKRDDRRRKILSSGETGIASGRIAAEGLRNLQLYIRLSALGMSPQGNVIDFCRVTCSPDQKNEILSIAGKRGGLLILSDQLIGSTEQKRRLKKNVTVESRELVIAACNDELFALIDLRPKKFIPLSDREGAEEVGRIWKYREEVLLKTQEQNRNDFGRTSRAVL